MASPLKFLLNQGSEGEAKDVVEAPAFSLTKVLSAGAVIIAPIAALIVDSLKDKDLKPSHYVALAIALLGFLAITAAADVLARALATAAERNAQASAARIGQFIQFQSPLDAHRVTSGEDRKVTVLAAATAGEPYFLVKEGDSINWRPASGITIP